jgi:DNA-binding HxlR family transcriptional regulator
MDQKSIDAKMEFCPVIRTVVVMGGKWKPRILWHLRLGSAGFGELQRAIGASERMLSKSLSELIRDGIITRKETNAGKVMTTEYAYSDYGLTLVPVLNSMGNWGLKHTDSVAVSQTV